MVSDMMQKVKDMSGGSLVGMAVVLMAVGYGIWIWGMSQDQDTVDGECPEGTRQPAISDSMCIAGWQEGLSYFGAALFLAGIVACFIGTGRWLTPAKPVTTQAPDSATVLGAPEVLPKSAIFRPMPGDPGYVAAQN